MNHIRHNRGKIDSRACHRAQADEFAGKLSEGKLPDGKAKCPGTFTGAEG